MFLVEVRHTPTFISATDKTPFYSMVTNALMLGWMVYARVLFFTLLVLTINDARLRARRLYLWLPVLLTAACAPYVAVFGWQRHVVPILVMAGTILVFLYMSDPRTRRAKELATQ